jgi:multidrug transporter EmrE-like cation transporter
MFIVLTILAAVFFTSGGALMKSSEGLTKLGFSIACLLFFVIGASFQAIAMRRAEMGTTYIFVLGLEAVLALGFGLLFFREALTVPKVGGAFLIVAGVILLRR